MIFRSAFPFFLGVLPVLVFDLMIFLAFCSKKKKSHNKTLYGRGGVDGSKITTFETQEVLRSGTTDVALHVRAYVKVAVVARRS